MESAPLSNLVAKHRTTSFTANAPVFTISTQGGKLCHTKKKIQRSIRRDIRILYPPLTPHSRRPPPSVPSALWLFAGPGVGLGSAPHHLLWSKSTYQGPVKATPYFQFSGLLAGLRPVRTGLFAPGRLCWLLHLCLHSAARYAARVRSSPRNHQRRARSDDVPWSTNAAWLDCGRPQ